MSDSPFVKYASGELSPDETYTVERLIDRVRSNFDDTYWERQMEESDAREKPDYQPSFKREHLEPAAGLLATKTWISLQRSRDKERPVRDLKAFRYLPCLTGLVLINNEVTDLAPLRECTRLRRLHLSCNPIRDLSPLVGCRELSWLELTQTAVQDLSVLEQLSELDELTISGAQIPAFKQLAHLAQLRRLSIGGEFDSFIGFPAMPKLRVIIGAKVESLEGLEQFTSLENLVNFGGEFDSLEPLKGLRKLTHFNAWGTRVASMAPLTDLVALRDLRLDTKARNIDLEPLGGLPALHDLSVKCDEREPASLANVRADLTSWDVEFLADKPRFTPSLTVEVVVEATFEHFNTEVSYGVKENEFNESLLSSELGWLEGRLDEVLSARFKADEDYKIPYRAAKSRSLTVVLLSKRAIKAFPVLVLGMQEVLSTARNDFIVYFQSDLMKPCKDDFIVWVYPDKIQVTEKYAATVQRLIKPRGLGRFFGL